MQGLEETIRQRENHIHQLNTCLGDHGDGGGAAEYRGIWVVLIYWIFHFDFFVYLIFNTLKKLYTFSNNFGA